MGHAPLRRCGSARTSAGLADLGARYGPFTLAAIPIGAYGVPAERWFHRPNHMDPTEAVRTHLDLLRKDAWANFRAELALLMASSAEGCLRTGPKSV